RTLLLLVSNPYHLLRNIAPLSSMFHILNNFNNLLDYCKPFFNLFKVIKKDFVFFCRKSKIVTYYVIQNRIEFLNVIHYNQIKITHYMNKEMERMGTIVCQECDAIIGHFNDEKVTVLYGTDCSCCGK